MTDPQTYTNEAQLQTRYRLSLVWPNSTRAGRQEKTRGNMSTLASNLPSQRNRLPEAIALVCTSAPFLVMHL